MPPRKRKKRFPEAELLARLRRYEEVLKRLNIDVEGVNKGSVEIAQKVGKIQISGETNPLGSSVSEQPIQYLSPTDSSGGIESSGLTGQSEEFRDTEALLQGSSEDEANEAPIMNTWDSSFIQDGHTLLLGGTPSDTSLSSFHPQPVHIFRLWQTFLDNINPIIKIFHAPTIQYQILEATTDLSRVPKNLEALMFGIYKFAVASLTNDDCQNMFGVGKSSLQERYGFALRQALFNVSFLKTSDIMVLQALTMYLLSSIHVVDPISLYCLTGITVRIGQRMGLDHDVAGGGVSPFDSEMRRRLWWQIVLLDTRVGEFTGALNSILTQPWTTKLPLNVNDSDLYPDMKEAPVESKGVTEMIFVLLRCEVGAFLRRSGEIGKGFSQANAIDELNTYIHHTYLSNCDSQIPLHLMSMLMAKSAISKLRMMMQYQFTRVSANQENLLSPAEKDVLFSSAIQMLDYHNSMLSSIPTRRFLWHIHTNYPFPASTYLLAELRTRSVGPLADQAWQVMLRSMELRKDPFSKTMLRHSPLHTAVSSLTLKAWEARENSLRQMQLPVSVPPLISHLRDELMSMRAQTPKPRDVKCFSNLADSDPYNLITEAGSQYPDATNMYTTQEVSQPPTTMDVDTSTLMNWDFWGTLIASGDMEAHQGAAAPQTFYQI
ncbi:hypothetical protein BP6252_00428 [Coleophoma cylindrospora]|uniref:Xylanolytic transcriptional activator regulatory domain-containing protein n=1 Tax=Coleophoma cylindrospora TaxID=1849047 RepID=A0A3D8SQ09_9HELO|nr:hypothetical protein BP6252_00428 [Coleophoma cylindrospora]